MAKKYKNIWNSREEHDAWEAHVDETLRRGYATLEKAKAERKSRADDARQTPAAEP